MQPLPQQQEHSAAPPSAAGTLCSPSLSSRNIVQPLPQQQEQRVKLTPSTAAVPSSTTAPQQQEQFFSAAGSIQPLPRLQEVFSPSLSCRKSSAPPSAAGKVQPLPRLQASATGRVQPLPELQEEFSPSLCSRKSSAAGSIQPLPQHRNSV